jgi:damage-control phosphatase, subfamily III
LPFSAFGNPSYFSFTEAFSSSDSIKRLEMIQGLGQKWKAYFNEGKFRLSVNCDLPLGVSSVADYWTFPYPYWYMQLDDPVLLKAFNKSSLVIFKGDLKYVLFPLYAAL